MIKKIQEKTELFIEFTPEEIESFGWEENQKLTVTENEDGSIVMTPHVKLEIDLDEFTKEELMGLIDQSCERDISMNDLIAEILIEVSERVIKEHK